LQLEVGKVGAGSVGVKQYIGKLIRVGMPDNERGIGYLGTLQTNGEGYWLQTAKEKIWLGQPRLGYVTNFLESPGQIIPRLQLWPA
jgi:hypothetical protein